MKKFLKILIFSLLIPFLASCGPSEGGETTSEEGSSPETSETSSSELPLKEQVLKNLETFTNYKVKNTTHSRTKAVTYGLNIVSGIDAVAYASVKDDDFDYSAQGTSSTEVKLSEYATAMGITVEQVIAQLTATHGDRVTIDLDNDKAVMSNPIVQHAIYHYDTTAKQYVEYDYDSTNTSLLLEAKYQKSSEGKVLIGPYELITKDTVEKGALKEDGKTFEYVLTAEEKLSDKYNISEATVNIVFQKFSLEVENAYPKKLTIEVDLDTTNTLNENSEIMEYSLTLEFSNRGETVITIPEGKVACDHHMYSHRSFDIDDEYHRLYCEKCHKYLEEKTAHSYDPDHKICTVCGHVKGIDERAGTDDETIDTNTLLYEDTTSGFKVYGYRSLISSQNEKYSISTMVKVDTATGIASTLRYGVDFKFNNSYYYSTQMGFAVSQGESFVEDFGCVRLTREDYKAYRGLTITEETPGAPRVGDQTLQQYLASHDPDYTWSGYISPDVYKHTGVPHQEEIDSCHTLNTLHCSECDRDYQSNISTHHEHVSYEPTSYETVLATCGHLGVLYSVSSEYTAENAVYLKRTCADCNEVAYVMIRKSDIDSDHASEYTTIYYITKKGVTADYGNTEAIIPHVYKDGHCVLCNADEPAA